MASKSTPNNTDIRIAMMSAVTEAVKKADEEAVLIPVGKSRLLVRTSSGRVFEVSIRETRS